MTPVSAVLLVQPTPLRGSARHAQMSSRIVLSLLTIKLVVRVPAAAPPMRKNTSDSTDGSDAAPAIGEFPSPTRSRKGDVIGPASNRTPDMSTPWVLATIIAGLPSVGIKVGNPSPSTTASGFVTRIGWSSAYTPGVRTRLLPPRRPALTLPTEL